MINNLPQNEWRTWIRFCNFCSCQMTYLLINFCHLRYHWIWLLYGAFIQPIQHIFKKDFKRVLQDLYTKTISHYSPINLKITRKNACQTTPMSSLLNTMPSLPTPYAKSPQGVGWVGISEHCDKYLKYLEYMDNSGNSFPRYLRPDIMLTFYYNFGPVSWIIWHWQSCEQNICQLSPVSPTCVSITKISITACIKKFKKVVKLH